MAEDYEVKLNVYRLKHDQAGQLSMAYPEETIWHTGVVVGSTEYYLGVGNAVQQNPNGTGTFGDPDIILDLGMSSYPKEQLPAYLERLCSKFEQQLYKFPRNNNYFSHRLLMCLVVASISPAIGLLLKEITIKTNPAEIMDNILNCLYKIERDHDQAQPNLRMKRELDDSLRKHENTVVLEDEVNKQKSVDLKIRLLNANLHPKRPTYLELRRREGGTDATNRLVNRLERINDTNCNDIIKKLNNASLLSCLSSAAERICKAKLTREDINSIVKVCSNLHQTYEKFGERLVTGLLQKSFATGKEMTLEVLKLKKSQKSCSMRLLLELFFQGIYKDLEHIKTIGQTIMYPKELSDEESPLDHLSLSTIFAKQTRFMAMADCDNPDRYAKQFKEALGITEKFQKGLKQMFDSYRKAAVKELESKVKSLSEKETAIVATLLRKKSPSETSVSAAKKLREFCTRLHDGVTKFVVAVGEVLLVELPAYDRILDEVYKTEEKVKTEKENAPRKPLDCLRILQRAVKALKPTTNAEAQPMRTSFMQTLSRISARGKRLFAINFHFLVKEEALNFLRFNFIFLGVQRTITRFVIITGKGGGDHGDSVIKPAIVEYAKAHNLHVTESARNKGVLTIQVDKNFRNFQIKKEEKY